MGSEMCIRDSCHSAPTSSTAAQSSDGTQSNGLDEQTGGKGKHEAIRTHLDLLGTILGDKSSQGRVSDVVGSVEHSIQQRVCNQEPCILCKLTEVRRNCKIATSVMAQPI